MNCKSNFKIHQLNLPFFSMFGPRSVE